MLFLSLSSFSSLAPWPCLDDASPRSSSPPASASKTRERKDEKTSSKVDERHHGERPILPMFCSILYTMSPKTIENKDVGHLINQVIYHRRSKISGFGSSCVFFRKKVEQLAKKHDMRCLV